MLSNMESSSHVPPPGRPTPEEAASALRDAAHAAHATRTGLVLPRGYSLMTGAANAVFAYGIAAGNSDWRFGQVAFVASLLLMIAVGLAAKERFRRCNGAWVSGFGGPRATWRAVGAFVVVLVVCIVGATALMVAGHPVWSALVALAALPLTAVADRWWMAAYRATGAGA